MKFLIEAQHEIKYIKLTQDNSWIWIEDITEATYLDSIEEATDWADKISNTEQIDLEIIDPDSGEIQYSVEPDFPGYSERDNPSNGWDVPNGLDTATNIEKALSIVKEFNKEDLQYFLESFGLFLYEKEDDVLKETAHQINNASEVLKRSL